MSRSREENPRAVLQAYMDELLTGPEIEYADPQEEQRQRLQKLLYSARAQQAAPPRISDPVVVDPEAKTTVATPTPPRPVAPPEPPAPQVVEAPREVPAPEAPAEPEPTMAAMPTGMKEVEWLENGRPAWAQERFDVLLFKVSGLTLAVPLIALGQIQPLTDELTPLFGQADWFMGLLPTPGGKIRTVNTAKFVMPERYDERFLETAQYVISIDGVPWGLAVDSVNQPISLNPEDVKWRSERSRRPWLAGTVKDYMCALLDIPKVGQLLMEADRKRA
ncbi:chemotaxis protein CheW [Marinimicrobium locisalis]|uniref:chemotaxis protein CheW n=1 Tax=Marinimicrobium locisalis TaxID=546022 RepID=UPI0032213C5B